MSVAGRQRACNNDERMVLSDLTDRFALTPRQHATVTRDETTVVASA